MRTMLAAALLLLVPMAAHAQQLIPVIHYEPVSRHVWQNGRWVEYAWQNGQWVQCWPPSRPGPVGPTRPSPTQPGPRFVPPPNSNRPTPDAQLPPNVSPQTQPAPQQDQEVAARLKRLEELIERLANRCKPCPPETPQPDPVDPDPGCKCDLGPIYQKLAELQKAIEALQQPTDPGPDPSDAISAINDKLDELNDKIDNLPSAVPTDTLQSLVDAVNALEQGLTDINSRLDNNDATTAKVAEAIKAMAEASAATHSKLDAAIALFKEGIDGEIKLVVQSHPNIPQSYVDTSTIWAVQSKTGISHVVLVYNSEDPEWDRLKASYEQAKTKFPSIQLVDVQSKKIKTSPTPQLVIYYTERTGKEPEVIVGDRAVASKLRDFYTFSN